MLLREEIFSGIAAKEILGYKGISLLRRTVDGGEEESVTIMWFDSLQAVKLFLPAKITSRPWCRRKHERCFRNSTSDRSTMR